MHPILAKTVGGLSPAYYFRQLVFGVALCVIALLPGFLGSKEGITIPAVVLAFALLCTALYPYSRFVYEGIVGFIMGSNVIAMPLPVMLIWKLLTMVLCWAAAIFIAPVGLAYLYWHHSRQQR